MLWRGKPIVKSARWRRHPRNIPGAQRELRITHPVESR
jgi:hypothetical protein